MQHLLTWLWETGANGGGEGGLLTDAKYIPSLSVFWSYDAEEVLGGESFVEGGSFPGCSLDN